MPSISFKRRPLILFLRDPSAAEVAVRKFVSTATNLVTYPVIAPKERRHGAAVAPIFATTATNLVTCPVSAQKKRRPEAATEGLAATEQRTTKKDERTKGEERLAEEWEEAEAAVLGVGVLSI